MNSALIVIFYILLILLRLIETAQMQKRFRKIKALKYSWHTARESIPNRKVGFKVE